MTSEAGLISASAVWKDLASHAKGFGKGGVHLRKLLSDGARNKQLRLVSDGMYVDFSRQQMVPETMTKLQALLKEANVENKIKRMAAGDPINATEGRAVMHVALRSDLKRPYFVNGTNVSEQVHKVLNQIESLSKRVRDGVWKGHTGKAITNVLSVGIGGSYLGAEFVMEALKTDSMASQCAAGRTLKFLANVDPTGFARATQNLDPETTMCIVISKSFGTQETIMNASLCREWLTSAMGKDCVSKHIVSCSANPDKASKFGIDPSNVFHLWDWVGGRYSVTSAVGILPLSLHYGYEIMQKFLSGARSMDNHFLDTPPEKNIPMVLGMVGVWNSSFLEYSNRALIPYSEALTRLPAHLQQLDMESNGKRVAMDGTPLDFQAGEIDFGEPGTNAQHSFFQLVHQGRTIPVDFIGFVKPHVQSGSDVLNKMINANHDELMSNFFAQADALALGKTAAEVRSEGVAESLVPHKVFSGNRPSTLILVEELSAFSVGQLLSLFEHRTAVQGFIWGLNSFDQWGVELGKLLGKKVRKALTTCREEDGGNASNKALSDFNPATQDILKVFLGGAVKP